MSKDIAVLLNKRDRYWTRLLRNKVHDIETTKQALVNFERALYKHHGALYDIVDHKCNIDYLKKYVSLFPRYMGINYHIDLR